MGSEILTFDSHCSANFQQILNCFIPKFKLEYGNLENIKTDCVSTVVLNLHQIKRLKFFFGTPGVNLPFFESYNKLPWLKEKANTVDEWICEKRPCDQCAWLIKQGNNWKRFPNL